MPAMNQVRTALALITFLFLTGCAMEQTNLSADRRFSRISNKYSERLPALNPVSGTSLGDHRFDSELDQVNEDARAEKRAFYRGLLNELAAVSRNELSRDNQIDYSLLEHQLKSSLWYMEELQEWAWNPLAYTRLAGGSLYSLMARDFAPIEKRLMHAADRLRQFPRLFSQIRATLIPDRVPRIHAQTAVEQNSGVLSIIDHMIRPQLDKLSAADKQTLQEAIEVAAEAVQEHQKWLEETLLPQAAGEFRLGEKRYDKKLSLVLNSNLTRSEIRKRAEAELGRVRNEMFLLSKTILNKQDPARTFSDTPAGDEKQKIIEEALELAYADRPEREKVVATAKASLKEATAFVREKALVSIPDADIDIIIMPEFQRGVSVAYCDSPGALEDAKKTFYAISPLPDDWTDEQVHSFLREYNTRSIYNLTVHEAMPGHFLQLAHSNTCDSTLRALLSSGVFIEGWAVYTETMMANAGFPDGNPLSKLVVMKWYLRGIANAILDQAIHTEDMSREDAMKLMTVDTFQEEREAAGKWKRAQLTSTQLSTYFVGVQEHWDLRERAEKEWGAAFSLKRYHDAILDHGSPPTRFVEAMVFNEPIPE